MGSTKAVWQSDVLEDAITRLGAAESLTIEARIVIRQNGEDKITGDVLVQSSGENGYIGLNIVSADDGARELEMSISGGICVLRTGRDFYEMPVQDGSTFLRVTDVLARIDVPHLLKSVEELLGKASESMTVSDAGVRFHLEEGEVPFRLDFALSFVDDFALGRITIKPFIPKFPSHASVRYGVKGGNQETESIDKEDITLPLGRSLHTKRILLDVPMEGGAIGDIHCTIALAGQGAEHTVLETELSADIRVIEANAAEPAAVDTTGVEMKPLAPPDVDGS